MTEDRCRVCESPLHGAACSRCDRRIARPDLLEPPPGRGLAEALAGLRLAARGARLTLRTPRLLVLVILPLLLSLTLFAIMVALVWNNRELVRPDLVQTWPWGLDWLRRAVVVAAEGLGVLIGVGIAVVATVIASQVINAPFLEWLSVAVESIVLGRPDRTPFSMAHLWRTSVVPIFQAMGLAVVQALFGLLFLILSMLAVTAPLAMLGGLWLVALSLCDLAIARKGLPVRERFRRVRRALPLYLGLALPFFVAPFLLPLGAAGATLADLRRRASLAPRDPGVA
jgi:CysZ protein